MLNIFQISCLGIARRSLYAILKLPPDQYTWIARSMWTVSTHLVTAVVWVMFEQLFGHPEEVALFDRSEILDIVGRTKDLLQELQDRSQIAKRGVRLIGFFLEVERAMASGHSRRLDISDIIEYVQRDNEFFGNAAEFPDAAMPCATSWMADGVNAWEALLGAGGSIDFESLENHGV